MSIRTRPQRRRRLQDGVLQEALRTTSRAKAMSELIEGRGYVIENGDTVFTARKIVAEEGDWVPSKLDETPARKVGGLLGVRFVRYELELREKVKRARGI